MKRLFVLLAVTAIGWLSSSASREAADPKPEQSHFSVEQAITPVERPGIPPESLMEQLMADNIAMKASKGCQETSLDGMLSSWFETSGIHLDGPEELDLVILPKNPCLNGPNVGPFWLARPMHSGYQLLLSTGGHDLEVLNVRHKGYRDIRVLSATATVVSTVVFRFDGEKYRAYAAKNQPIK